MSHPPPTTSEIAFFLITTIIAILLTTKQRKPLDWSCIIAISLLTAFALASILLLRSTGVAATFAIAALCCARE
jgi:hypothetical membrane protein